MISGFDRYYQITRCFRDEDLRADRQPEFTQIDIETSFLQENDIMGLMEDMIRRLFADVINVDLPDPFPRISYADAMFRYGSDKPDLRVPLELTELTDLMQAVPFQVFRDAAQKPGGRVAALRIPGGGELSRKEIDEYTQFVGIYGAKGLAYIKINDLTKGMEGLQSPILKFLPEPVVQSILERTRAQNNDLVFSARTRPRLSTTRWEHCASKSDMSVVWLQIRGNLYGLWIFQCSNGMRKKTLASFASPLYCSQPGTRRFSGKRSGQGTFQSVRHGAERYGNWRWFHSYSPAGRAEQGIPGIEYLGRGSKAEIRFSAGFPAIWCPSAWRHRLWS